MNASQKSNWTYINAPCNWTRLTERQNTFLSRMFESKLHIKGLDNRLVQQLISRNLVQTVGGFVEWTHSAHRQLAGYMRDDNMPEWIRNLADTHHQDFENNQPEPAPQLVPVPDALAKNGRVLIERGSVFQAPKFGIGDKVLYYGKLFWVLSADFVNGTYAYQLQDTDGEIIGALIAESEIESPVQSEIVEIPDVLAEAREREELYLTQIAEYQKFNVEKDERIAKLEGDLKAAQATIVQAGAMVEKKSRSLLDALEANVQLKQAMREAIAGIDSYIGIDYNFPKISAAKQALASALLFKSSASEESPNVAQAVTLTVGGVSGLAKMSNGTQFIGLTGMLGNQMLPLLVKAEERGLFTAYNLASQFDTPANREAIEVCRQKMNAENAAIEERRQALAQS